MIGILSPTQLKLINHETPMLDPSDIEYDIVYNSNATPINIPDCFKDQIFKELYGVDIDNVKFADGDKLNWKFSNILFRY